MKLCSQVGGNSDFETETRQAALELVITVVEGKPAYVRKDGPLLAALCECHMGLLLNIEDTEAWHAAIEEQDRDDGALPPPHALWPSCAAVVLHGGAACSTSCRQWQEA